MLAYAQGVDAEHVEAGDDQRREGQHGGLEVYDVTHGCGVELDAEDAEDEADGQRPRVAHEYLGVLVDVAEDVEVEEGDQHAERGEREDGQVVAAQVEERDAVYGRGYGAEARGQAVDAVYEVDGVDEEHYDDGGEGIAYPGRELADAGGSGKGVEPAPARKQQDGAYYLYHKLGAVLDADEVVGHAYEIEHLYGAERGYHEYGVAGEGDYETAVSEEYVAAEDKGYAQEYHGLEGYASEARDRSLVYLSFVYFIKKVSPVCYEQNLRYENTCT